MSEQRPVKLLHTREPCISTHTHTHANTQQRLLSITYSSLLKVITHQVASPQDLDHIAGMTQNFSLTQRDKVPLDAEHIKMQ